MDHLSISVSDPEQPDGEFQGENNMVSFWESLHLRLISRGFLECEYLDLNTYFFGVPQLFHVHVLHAVPSQNPFVVGPTNGIWTLWLGMETHEDNTVLNTEMEKAPLKRSIAEAQLDDVTDEELLKSNVCYIIHIFS